MSSGSRSTRAVADGLGFLARRQLPSGQFAMRMGPELRHPDDGIPDACAFATAVIAYSLGFSDTPLAREIVTRALGFLAAEMEPPGVWRYWSADHPGNRDIPPDVDDTAVISYVLVRHAITVPDNRRLLGANRDHRGRFYTWLAPRWARPPVNVDYWRVVSRQLRTPLRSRRFWSANKLSPNDVASVVNANVLLYLGDGPATERASAYLHEVVRRDAEVSSDQWYRSRFAFYHAVSRCAYAGVGSVRPMLDTIVERITAAAGDDGSIGSNALETALAVCALHNCEHSGDVLERAAAFLLEAQEADGGWPLAPFYYGGEVQWGSQELTTGLCLEALSRHYAAERSGGNADRAS
ncbi:MAG: hypothetical protein ABSG64_04520 [Solirubrobacteraceae bacterium]